MYEQFTFLTCYCKMCLFLCVFVLSSNDHVIHYICQLVQKESKIGLSATPGADGRGKDKATDR